jgi:hypothetical protein
MPWSSRRCTPALEARASSGFGVERREHERRAAAPYLRRRPAKLQTPMGTKAANNVVSTFWYPGSTWPRVRWSKTKPTTSRRPQKPIHLTFDLWMGESSSVRVSGSSLGSSSGSAMISLRCTAGRERRLPLGESGSRGSGGPASCGVPPESRRLTCGCSFGLVGTSTSRCDKSKSLLASRRRPARPEERRRRLGGLDRSDVPANWSSLLNSLGPPRPTETVPMQCARFTPCLRIVTTSGPLDTHAP